MSQNTKNVPLDEKSFDISLSGGPIHTDLLFATASFKQELTDRKIKEPVALVCKWFTLSPSDELQEIQGVTGAFYQPCADDIGMKIKVEACPVLGLKEYKGQPLTAEAGPLTMDAKIDSEIQKNLQTNRSFVLKVDSVSLEDEALAKDLELPGEGVLEIERERIVVWLGNRGRKVLEWDYRELPSVNMVRKSNNIFEIRFDKKNIVKFSAKNNIDRDVIGMTIRSFAGERVLERLNDEAENQKHEMEDQNDKLQEENDDVIIQNKNKFVDPNSPQKDINENINKAQESNDAHDRMQENSKENITHLSLTLPFPRNNNDHLIISSAKLNPTLLKRNSTSDYELLLKLEQLSREVSRHITEKEALKQEQTLLIEKNDNLEAKNKDISEQLGTCKKNFFDLETEHDDLKKKFESLLSQKHFYFQEIDIYKAESQSKDEIIDNLKKEMNKLMPSYPNKHKLTWMEIEDLKKNLEDSTTKITILKKEKQDLTEKIERMKENLDEFTRNNEEMINELNYLRKKCESLALEKSIVPHTPRKDDDNSQSFSNSAIKNKERSRENTEGEEKMETSMIISAKKNNNSINNYQQIYNGVEEENKKLKEQINQLEITIETLKITLSQEVNNKKNGKKLNRTNTMPLKLQNNNGKSLIFNSVDIQFLQKLANSLTETIADRELALENQKNINKELIKRLYELEEKLMKSKKTTFSQNL